MSDKVDCINITVGKRLKAKCEELEINVSEVARQALIEESTAPIVRPSPYNPRNKDS